MVLLVEAPSELVAPFTIVVAIAFTAGAQARSGLCSRLATAGMGWSGDDR